MPGIPMPGAAASLFLGVRARTLSCYRLPQPAQYGVSSGWLGPAITFPVPQAECRAASNGLMEGNRRWLPFFSCLCWALLLQPCQSGRTPGVLMLCFGLEEYEAEEDLHLPEDLATRRASWGRLPKSPGVRTR
jgi:hypothetical protein